MGFGPGFTKGRRKKARRPAVLPYQPPPSPAPVAAAPAPRPAPGPLPVPPPPPAFTRQPFSVVILSAKSDNLTRCLTALFTYEPELPRERVIVIDDGARAGCEAVWPGIRWIPGIKPFIFARNANMGFRAAEETDVILLNDDALLETYHGFSWMAAQLPGRQDIGACSASIRGLVGNLNQVPKGIGLRANEPTLAFISVLIPRFSYNKVGALDERFVGYGYEDTDWCARARQENFRLAVFDGCIVAHDHPEHSTFRTRKDFQVIEKQSHDLYRQKWGR